MSARGDLKSFLSFFKRPRVRGGIPRLPRELCSAQSLNNPVAVRFQFTARSFGFVVLFVDIILADFGNHLGISGSGLRYNVLLACYQKHRNVKGYLSGWVGG